jgi:hypothetical protein
MDSCNNHEKQIALIVMSENERYTCFHFEISGISFYLNAVDMSLSLNLKSHPFLTFQQVDICLEYIECWWKFCQSSGTGGLSRTVALVILSALMS